MTYLTTLGPMALTTIALSIVIVAYRRRPIGPSPDTHYSYLSPNDQRRLQSRCPHEETMGGVCMDCGYGVH